SRSTVARTSIARRPKRSSFVPKGRRHDRAGQPISRTVGAPSPRLIRRGSRGRFLLAPLQSQRRQLVHLVLRRLVAGAHSAFPECTPVIPDATPSTIRTARHHYRDSAFIK